MDQTSNISPDTEENESIENMEIRTVRALHHGFRPGDRLAINGEEYTIGPVNGEEFSIGPAPIYVNRVGATHHPISEGELRADSSIRIPNFEEQNTLATGTTGRARLSPDARTYLHTINEWVDNNAQTIASINGDSWVRRSFEYRPEPEMTYALKPLMSSTSPELIDSFFKDAEEMDKLRQQIFSKVANYLPILPILVSSTKSKYVVIGSPMDIEVSSHRSTDGYAWTLAINCGGKQYMKALSQSERDFCENIIRQRQESGAPFSDVAITNMQYAIGPIIDSAWKEYVKKIKEKTPNISVGELSSERAKKIMEEIIWLNKQLEKDTLIPSSKVKFAISSIEKILSGV